MTVYDFKDVETGEVVGVEFPMGKAPRIGARVRRGGRELRRIPSRPPGKPPVADYRFIAWSQNPDECKGVEHRVKVGGLEFAAFTSRREVERFESANEGRIRYRK